MKYAPAEKILKPSSKHYIVMMNLTRLLASDGEGASKLLECTVSDAPDIDTAIIVAKSVIRSPLLKCAVFRRLGTYPLRHRLCGS